MMLGGLHPDEKVGTFLIKGESLSPGFSSSSFGSAPSFISLAPDGSTAYVANHGSSSPGVSAVSLKWGPGGDLISATPLQPQVRSPDPCHVSLHPNGHWLLSASYSEGSVTVFPVLQGGLLGTPNTTELGKNAHQVMFWSSDEVLVPLLGSDEVAVCEFEETSGSLRHMYSIAFPPSSGPRHLAFHPTNNSLAYVACELSNTVGTIYRRVKDGVWETRDPFLSTIRTGLPVPTVQAVAALAISSGGDFLYVSNRAAPFGTGDNSVAGFRISSDGNLSPSPFIWAVGGEGPGKGVNFPRDITLSPDGKFLAVANQHGGSVSMFKRSEDSGNLSFLTTVSSAPVTAPSSVLITF